jgi:hypothetical protein
MPEIASHQFQHDSRRDHQPFVCNRLPASCDVVVIGENPASKMKKDWWLFWDHKNGFHLDKFEEAYKKARLANSKPPISPTRLRLKRLRCNGLRCLETNFFSNEQLGGAGGGTPNGELLTTLIRHHIPHLKAVIVHGSVARKRWRKLGLELPDRVQSYCLRHFSRLSYAEIDEVSRKIQGTSVSPRHSG